MMKKFMMLLSLIALFLTPIFALAEEDFILNETAVLNGMGRSWAQGYEPVSSNGGMTLYFPLTSQRCEGRVTVTLRMKDETVSPFTGSMSGRYQKTNGMYRVNLRLELLDERVNGDYAAELLVTGQDELGQALASTFPLVIRIRDGRSPEETVRPRIDGMQSALTVGEDSVLTVMMSNPSRYAGMSDLMLTFAEPTGDILPAATNKMILSDLMPGETAEIAIPLKVIPTASVALHQLQLTLSWTALGQRGEWTETLTLPVTQEMRVEHGSLSVPVTCLQGSLASVSLPLMNMGRGEVRNVLATLVVPGVTEGQSVLVGTIPAGETKEAKLTFTPGKTVLGDLTGELRVSYEDPWGNAGAFSLPFCTTVEEPITFEAAMAEESKEVTPRWLLPTLGGGCGALLLALILQGTLLRRKIHKLEEDRL